MSEKEKKLTLRDFFWSFINHFGALQLINLLFLIPVLFFGGGIFALCWFSGTINVFVCTLIVPLLMPFAVGMTYAMKNMIFGECKHPIKDYFKGIRENLKQAFFHGIFMYVIVSGLWLTFALYQQYIGTSGFVIAAFVVSVIISAVVLFASFHVPMMIVTLKLKLKDIYKNAFIFVFAGIGGNIKTLLSFALIGSVMGMIVLCSGSNLLVGLIVAAVLFLWIGFVLCGYIITFNAYPTTKKYAIDPYKKSGNVQKTESENLYENITYEDIEAYLDGDPNEFVYINGRMMKRASLQVLASKLKKL